MRCVPKELAGLGCSGVLSRPGPRYAEEPSGVALHLENNSQGQNSAQPRTTPPCLPPSRPPWCPPPEPHHPSWLTRRHCPRPHRGPWQVWVALVAPCAVGSKLEALNWQGGG